MSKSEWKIGEAKQRFSEVVRRSAEEPQLIFNWVELSAALVSAEDYRAFEEWNERRSTIAATVRIRGARGRDRCERREMREGRC